MCLFSHQTVLANQVNSSGLYIQRWKYEQSLSIINDVKPTEKQQTNELCAACILSIMPTIFFIPKECCCKGNDSYMFSNLQWMNRIHLYKRIIQDIKWMKRGMMSSTYCMLLGSDWLQVTVVWHFRRNYRFLPVQITKVSFKWYHLVLLL